jgi:hypothetical protein
MGNIKGSELTASIKTINPQVARTMLATCKRNRRVSMCRVKRLSQSRRRGEWVIAQPIMVNCDGTLIDGQHRLRMVIHTGLPTDFLVISGFDREGTFAKLDDTGARRLKDWLEIRGEPLPEILAGVINMAARDEAGLMPTGSGSFILTGPEGLDFLESHPKIRESVVEAPGTVNRLAPRTMLCFSHYKFAAKDNVLANSFFVDLVTGDKEAEGDPIYLLREKLKANRIAKTKLPRSEMLALIIKAWNAVRGGQTLKQLKWTSTGPKAEAFPEVT